MKNKISISCHQFGVIAGLMLLTLKLTSLPSLMYESSEIGGVFSICIMCLFNIAILGLLVWIKLKYNNRSIFDILSAFWGKFITRLLYFILFVFFVFKLLALIDDGFGFIRDVADEEFTYINFVICFFPVICALAYSGIRNLARTCEFFFPFVLIGLVVAIIFSFAPINFFGIGSLSRLSFSSVANVLSKLSFWNGDLFAIIIFMDKIDIKKGKLRNVFSPTIIVSAILTVCYIMYFSLYQETSVLHSNMIFDIVEYSIGTSNGWHMDIFAIIVYMVCLFLQGGIYVYCTDKVIEQIFNFQNKYIIFTALVVLLISAQFLFMNDYLKYVIFAQTYLSVFSAILLGVITIILFFVAIFKRRKNARNYQEG